MEPALLKDACLELHHSRVSQLKLSLCALATIANLAGCATMAAPAPSNSDNTQDVTGVFERIRQDVGNYELQAAQWRGLIKPKIPDPAMPAAPFAMACGKSLANYDFDVTKVEVSLQVVASNTSTADVGLKIPIGGASLGPDVNGSLARTQTNTIVLDRIPSNDPTELVRFRDGPDYTNLTTGHKAFLTAHPALAATHPPVFPISDTIIGLRKSLLAASGKLPCFDIAHGESVDDSIKIDFEVDKAVDPTLGFTFLVVTAKADDKIESKVDNTITVTIAPHAKLVAKLAKAKAGKK